MLRTYSTPAKPYSPLMNGPSTAVCTVFATIIVMMNSLNRVPSTNRNAFSRSTFRGRNGRFGGPVPPSPSPSPSPSAFGPRPTFLLSPDNQPAFLLAPSPAAIVPSASALFLLCTFTIACSFFFCAASSFCFASSAPYDDPSTAITRLRSICAPMV